MHGTDIAEFLKTRAPFLAIEPICQPGDAISWRDTISPLTKWCPACLSTDEVPYIRSAWSFELVTVCELHRTDLETTCACGHKVPLFSSSAEAIPSCSHCHRPLSEVPTRDHSCKPESLLIAAEIGRVVGWLSGIRPPVNGSLALRCVITAIDPSDSLPFSQIAKQLQVNKSNISTWKTTATRPSFSSIAKMCFGGGVDLLAALQGKSERGIQAHIRTRPKNLRYRPAHRNSIIRRIQESAKANELASINELARAAKIDVGTLTKWFPTITTGIQERRRMALSKIRETKWKEFTILVERKIQECMRCGIPLTQYNFKKAMGDNRWHFRAAYRAYVKQRLSAHPGSLDGDLSNQ
jgi:hypothetical protein